jgi:AP-3 complex subunit delta-1
MYGYDFSWGSFQVIEVMSAPTLKDKAIGYLAASLSFKPDTDVLMLTTNLIKKVENHLTLFIDV